MKAWTTQFSVQPHVESVLEWDSIHEASCQTDDKARHQRVIKRIPLFPYCAASYFLDAVDTKSMYNKA
ncbi:hypothetical protein [Nostoc sp. CHAB 5715]|uniref:hypothetical protein n=1 Tax=Nostoc sp. CHAB 5715 TaxID=2780400 RepID=UPI001E2AD185|nr:hypothetical protein [Nostoc sp. CHAB 5715]MCC5621460.1 hypothetical protein [Nostoc sp. CHAB 5715]